MVTRVIGPEGDEGWLNDTAGPLFNALQYAALAHWGYMMPVTSAGRSKAEQGRLWRGWLSRLPGYSPAYPPDSPYALHVVGGGQAVDVGGAFGRYGTPQHEWLRHWGPVFGYAVDAVAGEPWHIQQTLVPQVNLASVRPTVRPIKPLPPIQAIPEERFNMATIVIYTNEVEHTRRSGAIMDSVSGLFTTFGDFPPSYADGIAKGFGAEKAAPVTRAHFDKLNADMAKLRGK